RARDDPVGAPPRPTEPPTGHTETLGERMKLDRDIHRSGDLENRRRDVTVERDLAVRIVIREHEIVFATRGDDTFQILPRRNGGGGIVRIVEIDELRALQYIPGNLVQLEQEIGARRQVVEIRLSVGEYGSAMIDRVPWDGHDRDVARIQHRSRKVRDAFLRAEQRMQLLERIDRDAETPLHVRGGGLAERRQPELEPVTAHRGILERAC